MVPLLRSKRKFRFKSISLWILTLRYSLFAFNQTFARCGFASGLKRGAKLKLNTPKTSRTTEQEHCCRTEQQQSRGFGSRADLALSCVDFALNKQRPLHTAGKKLVDFLERSVLYQPAELAKVGRRKLCKSAARQIGFEGQESVDINPEVVTYRATVRLVEYDVPNGPCCSVAPNGEVPAVIDSNTKSISFEIHFVAIGYGPKVEGQNSNEDTRREQHFGVDPNFETTRTPIEFSEGGLVCRNGGLPGNLS